MPGTTPDDWCPPATPPLPPLPAGTTGRLIPTSPSALCSMGWRNLMITGLCRDILTRHFLTPLSIEEPDLRHLVWREGVRTGILIESIYRWRGNLVEKRPAIIIKPNGRKNVRIGIGDAAGATAQGQRKYQTFWVGSHTLFCIHGTGASADILATEVQREMTEWAPVIVQNLGLNFWQVTEVGTANEIEEARENFAIPVVVSWVYKETWQINLESRKLRNVSLNTMLDGALVTRTV